MEFIWCLHMLDRPDIAQHCFKSAEHDNRIIYAGNYR
eukprot:UN16919